MSDKGGATVINDRYEVHKRIGRGGMADVFSARDLLLDRQVAMKVLFPEFATDANFVERFRREAQSAANLSHPNIVSVYDWGKFEGTYFIAMEEVQGRTLAEVLKSNKQLTAKQAAEIASEVAAALGHAHEGGVAHRDIKPANILIGTNGQVKVADFGIARAMNSPTEANLTQVGSVMGTATYFSPEQAQGAQPDPRSDLYSLGIVMYEMVSGRPPFSGDNPVSIAYKQVHDAPQPLVQLVADVPRSYEAIVAKLLAKDPKRRYPNAGELREDLRRFRSGEPVHALSAAASAQGVALAGGTGATATTAMSASDPNATTVGPATRPGVAAATARANVVPRAGMQEAGYPTGASSDAMYYDSSSSRTGWYALAAFVALIALVVGGVLLFQSLNNDDAATTEATSFELADYVGRPLPDVIAEMRELKLEFRTEQEETGDFPTNAVIRTDPIGGTIVLEGQEIVVFYNPDQQVSPIPNVVGQPIDQARSALEAAGFSVGTEETEQTDLFAPGIVSSMDPVAGTQANAGDPVNLVIAGPPDSISVPGFLVGQTEDAALQVLRGDPYGFNVTVKRVASSTIEVGRVIELSPGGNSLLPRGGAITLSVSNGPAPVTVAGVTGQTEGGARNRLTTDGLTVKVNYADVPAGSPDDGRVTNQDLAPGSLAPPGSLVTLTVGRSVRATTTLPPPTTAVPVTAAPTTSAPPAPTTVAPTTLPPPVTTVV